MIFYFVTIAIVSITAWRILMYKRLEAGEDDLNE